MRNAKLALSETKLYICHGAISVMEREVEMRSVAETGGIFVGYKAERSVVVTHATGPGPNAKHSLFNFERDVAFCNEELERLFYISNRALGYIGEWHTHPFGFLSPSGPDDKAMFGISRSRGYRNKEPILMIAKRKLKGEGLAARCFLYSGKARAEIEYSVCGDIKFDTNYREGEEHDERSK